MSCKQRKLLIFLLLMSSFIGSIDLIARDAVAKPLCPSGQERKLSPGDKVNVSNRFVFGSINIAGWDRNTVEAIATTDNGTESVPVSITYDPSNVRRVLIITSPGGRSQNSDRVHLEVKIPRDAELEPIYVPNAEVKVTDVKGIVEVRSDTGTIVVQRVGAVKARTGSGEIQVTEVGGPVTLRTSSANVTVTGIRGDVMADVGSANMRVADADGLINVTTTTGNLEVENAGGNVRVVSINGRTNIRCVKGRVDVSDTSGVITLTGVEGDVDVMTSGGRASFTGPLRGGGHYRLRTLSGAVQMAVPDDASDFTVTLSSYSGNIETDFAPQGDSTPQSGRARRRIVRRYGDGRAQIELDAFNGRVRLGKISSSAIEKCER